MSKHWVITGVGSGLGKAVAAAALGRGDRVTGLLRNVEAARAFEMSAEGRGAAHIVDVTDRAGVFAAIAAAEDVAPIDILLNNAGNAFECWIEEGDPDAVRALYETNVMGPLHAIQAVLPAMRGRGRGHIVNISSGGGILGVPWVGLYSSSKFALEGLSEALAQEVGPLGLHVTIVEPGAFRTNLLVREHARLTTTIPDYERAAGKMRERIGAMGGNEPGDPAKFAAAMLLLADAENPPLRLALGDDAIAMALAKADSIRRDVEAWRHVGSNLAHSD